MPALCARRAPAAPVCPQFSPILLPGLASDAPWSRDGQESCLCFLIRASVAETRCSVPLGAAVPQHIPAAFKFLSPNTSAAQLWQRAWHHLATLHVAGTGAQSGEQNERLGVTPSHLLPQGSRGCPSSLTRGSVCKGHLCKGHPFIAKSPLLISVSAALHPPPGLGQHFVL